MTHTDGKTKSYQGTLRTVFEHSTLNIGFVSDGCTYTAAEVTCRGALEPYADVLATTGIAHCAPQDAFDQRYGEMLSLSRALTAFGENLAAYAESYLDELEDLPLIMDETTSLETLLGVLFSTES